MEIYVDDAQHRVLINWGRGPLTTITEAGVVSEQYTEAGDQVYDSAEVDMKPGTVHDAMREAGHRARLAEAEDRLIEFLAANDDKAMPDPVASLEYHDGMGMGLAVLNVADLKTVMAEYDRMTEAQTRRKAAA
jgi:hypothetical protein